MTKAQDYPHIDTIQTRWHDNDVYGHVNNVVYYSYFDSVVNRYLIEQGGLDIHRGEAIGFIVESHCQFLSPLAYPNSVKAGLRVAKLGNSSVSYELALWDHTGKLAAQGRMVHVFVNRTTQKSMSIPPGVRAALSRLLKSEEA